MPKTMKDIKQFYASLTPFYHTIYPNREASMQRQAFILDHVIKETWEKASTLLDVSCWIGTHASG